MFFRAVRVVKVIKAATDFNAHGDLNDDFDSIY